MWLGIFFPSFRGVSNALNSLINRLTVYGVFAKPYDDRDANRCQGVMNTILGWDARLSPAFSIFWSIEHLLCKLCNHTRSVLMSVHSVRSISICTATQLFVILPLHFHRLKSNRTTPCSAVSWLGVARFLVISWQIKHVKRSGVVLNLHSVAVQRNSQYAVQRGVDVSAGGHH